MISKEIAQTAISVAEEFDRRNLRVSVKSDSPLGMLVADSTVNFTVPKNVVLGYGDTNLVYAPTPDQIQMDTSYPSASDPESSTHDLNMDSIITDLSEMVTAHLSFAKNTVRPIIKTLVTNVSAAVASFPSVSTFNPNIIKVDLPEPMLNPSIQEAIQAFKENTFVNFDKAIKLPILTGEEVIELMKTGSKGVDADIDIWVGKLGVEFFRNLWANVFSCSGYSQFESFTKDKLNGADYAFGTYLLCTRLIDNPPENSGYNLPDYRLVIGELLEQSAVRLYLHFERRALDEKTKLMLKSYDKNTIYVFKPVYEDWLAAGGNNAVLFGNILTDKPMLFLDGINESAAESLQTWERQNRFLTTTMVNRRFVELKTMLMFEVEKLIAENIKECFGGYTKEQVITFHTPEVIQAMTYAQDYVDNLSSEDINDLWKICTYLVAGCVFYYTDSLKILLGIETACKINKDIDVKEAALISAIEYVTDYICDQLCVVDL